MKIKLGPWLFISQRCLITSDNTERELDPLSFKLLSYFVSNETRIVTRQELVERVWQQSFVDDNAINRAISELRKQLSHPEFKAGMIKTHYRKGYSLTVKVVPVAIANDVQQSETPSIQSQENDVETPTNNKSNDTLENNAHGNALLNPEAVLPTNSPNSNINSSIANKVTLVLTSVIVLLLIVVGYLWFAETDASQSSLPSEITISTIKKPIKRYKFSVTSATWNQGAESNPLLSRNKEFFAYSNIYQGVVNTHVKRSSDQAEVILKVPDYQVGGLSWQAGKNKLLTQLVNIDRKECHYALFDLTAFPELMPPTKLKSCSSVRNGYGQLDTDANYLYYTELVQGFAGAAIYQYDLKTQRAKVLVPPSDNPSGAIQLRLSPDGRFLAYLKAQVKAPMRVYIIDLITQETRLLHQMSAEHLNFSLNWFDDGKHLLVNELNKLIKINVESKAVDIVMLPQNVKPFYSALEFDNQLLLAQQNLQQYQLVMGRHLFSETASEFDYLHATDSSDFYPETANLEQHRHYFVSNRTGRNQIWLSDNKELQQLTYFDDAAKLKRLTLSHDGKRLLFLQGNEIAFLELATKEVHLITELANTSITAMKWGSKPQWIYFTSVVNDQKQLARFDLMTRQTTSIEAIDIKKLLADGLGNVFYLADKKLINVESGREYAVTLPITGLVFVNMSENYLYGTDALKSFYRMSLATGKVENVAIPFRQRDFTVVDDNTIIFTKRQYNNTSIKRVSWQEE
ncbi:winged helix-turn-helix domain-containing protein [Psychrobium sp. nBUS_13]|uniref:winged helix-turn-helix domain-containing protein n=1 Tax=Psychrobium sp. nBUS_13 TaxID=3395319 RepID=UPI003EBFF127